jgi:hypothetical protein
MRTKTGSGRRRVLYATALIVLCVGIAVAVLLPSASCGQLLQIPPKGGAVSGCSALIILRTVIGLLALLLALALAAVARRDRARSVTPSDQEDRSI